MELAECPVCLQNYDDACTIPRVVGCGHTACEACLLKLPQRFPQTIRCPACTQLVKFPAQGPSALPKNIDLLRLTTTTTTSDPHISHTHSTDYSHQHHFLPQFWSDDFYSLWKDWVLPDHALLLLQPKPDEKQGLSSVLQGTIVSAASASFSIRGGLKEGQRVSLLRLLSLSTVKDHSFIHYSYVVRIMKCLSGMKEELRDELGFILRHSGTSCKVSGLWGDLEDGFLYLVCERDNGSLLEKLGALRNGFGGGDEDGLSKDGVSAFALIGMEICEAVIGLHSQGLVTGCLGLSSFSFDCFGHVYVDMNELLVTGRKVHMSAVERVSGSGRLRIDNKELGVIFSDLLKSEAFVSPEILFELLKKEGVAIECGTLNYSVGFGSDVWSLACVLMRILIGKLYTEEIFDISEEKAYDYSILHTTWVEKVSYLLESKLGSEYVSLSRILCKCLNIDPGSRPLITDVRKCIKEVLIKPQFDIVGGFEGKVNEDKGTMHCVILGKLCRLPKERSEVQGREDSGGVDSDQVDEERVEKNFVEGLSEGIIKSKDLLAHLDCITGLVVGGGFLFSSSFDKTVHVWSLQDFSHVHTFKGHEHRVMALVYVDEEQLCISGDSGGGIFVWGISIPLGQDPIKKWYEQKDWRYSGIHSLTISGNGYLYTGSGDKLIKAWSLQDSTLACTLNGHKSVVSTLAACDGVLYSGSWDGTIRLWSLNDHSPLTVLGEDTPGNVISVLSLTADRHTLVAAHENGCIKVWRNDVLMKSTGSHNGAIFATGMEGKWLFTGGWDKNVKVQELSGDEIQIDVKPIGSIPYGSVITAILCWQGQLFVGYADRSIKVYYYGK